ncbi:hypothetical protein VTJ04DRAFT_8135 [Mycothermus thermophilus]|uniref:uncharacterized protein n=1 Tax=Humicola insolens TaxID=85995 RepID=UPI003743EF48
MLALPAENASRADVCASSGLRRKVGGLRQQGIYQVILMVETLRSVNARTSRNFEPRKLCVGDKSMSGTNGWK